MSTKKNNSAKGKRYSPAEKAEIIAFVEKVNAEKGRGGQSSASAKFGISQLTISSWLKASGSAPSTKGAAKVALKGDLGSKLGKLAKLAKLIDKASKELSGLQSQFEALKKSL